MTSYHTQKKMAFLDGILNLKGVELKKPSSVSDRSAVNSSLAGPDVLEEEVFFKRLFQTVHCLLYRACKRRHVGNISSTQAVLHGLMSFEVSLSHR